jgi:hypothetical protein
LGEEWVERSGLARSCIIQHYLVGHASVMKAVIAVNPRSHLIPCLTCRCWFISITT